MRKMSATVTSESSHTESTGTRRRTWTVVRIAITAVWAVTAALLLLGAWTPRFPTSDLLTLGLLWGLLYPVGLLLAVLGLALASWTWRTRHRTTAGVVAAASLALAVSALLPTTAMISVAHREGIALSSSALLGGSAPAEGPDATTTYRSVAGDELLMDVWQPAESDATGAAIVFVFGGGFAEGTRTDMAHLFRELTARGYTVFAGDYRLSTPDNPTYDEAPGDVRCSLGWAVEHAGDYGVDPTRIALAGASAGSNLALDVAYTTDAAAPSDCHQGAVDVAAVIDLYGPSDLAALHEYSPSADAVHFVAQYLGGTPTEVPDRYTELSPLTHVDPDVPPTLLLHGTADGMVPSAQSEALATALEDAGVDHRLLLLPWQQHGFDMLPGTLAGQIEVEEIDRFLAEHLD